MPNAAGKGRLPRLWHEMGLLKSALWYPLPEDGIVPPPIRGPFALIPG